ncbi:MAG: sugar phosphate isomerase/epimerase [Sphingomonas sp.]
MHSRISLHQVCLPGSDAAGFIAAAGAMGAANVVLGSPSLGDPAAVAAARAAMQAGGPRVAALCHPFAIHPNLADDAGGAAAALDRVADAAVAVGARAIYLLTGGRGWMSWEQAAARFAVLIGPVAERAQARGVSLMIENASPLYVDIHIAHGLADTIALAEQADIGVCADLFFCWAEAGLSPLFRRAMPRCGLVQVSDHVPGDRALPARAVPGDGAVPLEALLHDVLDAGYQGVFDIELIGPRIDAEGHAAATLRAGERVSEILVRLGVRDGAG